MYIKVMFEDDTTEDFNQFSIVMTSGNQKLVIPPWDDDGQVTAENIRNKIRIIDFDTIKNIEIYW
jgi:hypothetical protein